MEPRADADRPARLPRRSTTRRSTRARTFAYPAGRDNKPGQSNEDWTMTFAAVGTVAAPDPVTNLPGDAGRHARRPLLDEPDGRRSTRSRSSASPAPTPRPRPTARSSTAAPARSFSRHRPDNGTRYHYAVWVAARRPALAAPCGRTPSPTSRPKRSPTCRRTPGDLRSTSPGRTRRPRSTSQVVRKAGAPARRPERRHDRLHRHAARASPIRA